MLYRLIFAAGLVVFGQSALACACCADKGDRLIERLDRGAHEDEELARLRELGSAWVHVTACGFDCVKGLEPGRYTYDLGLTVQNGTFQLENAIGGIRLPLGAEFEHFAVDPDPMSDVQDPLLYRELRFSGVISASGMFGHVDGAEAELVLAGKGNSCWSASSLEHWVLTVKGDRAAFRLYGALFSGPD